MVSEIYLACQQGDVDLVRALIETSPSDKDINCLESNGSTALHAASSNGHAEIVELLLNKYGVRRHQKYDSGFTAYEVAKSAEIRKLFRRSDYNNNRFVNQQGFSVSVINVDWLRFHSNDSRIVLANYDRFTYGGILGNWKEIVDKVKNYFGIDTQKKTIEEWSESLQRYVDEHFSNPINVQYSNANECLERYSKTRQIENLLQLYTLDTCFCQYLAKDIDKTKCLYAAIAFNLSSISQRAYKGVCYRGLTMLDHEFEDYQRALKTKGSYLQLNTFSSTSADRAVAEIFIDPLGNRFKVLVIIDFVERCSTAIALYKISSDLPCISQYEDEKEVLILPGTIFSVTKIEGDDNSRSRTIYLKSYDLWSDSEERLSSIMSMRGESLMELIVD